MSAAKEPPRLARNLKATAKAMSAEHGSDVLFRLGSSLYYDPDNMRKELRDWLDLAATCRKAGGSMPPLYISGQIKVGAGVHDA